MKASLYLQLEQEKEYIEAIYGKNDRRSISSKR